MATLRPNLVGAKVGRLEILGSPLGCAAVEETNMLRTYRKDWLDKKLCYLQILGCSLGILDGMEEGIDDGAAEIDGCSLGTVDGTVEGMLDGIEEIEGASEGAEDGCTLGTEEGTDEGIALGIAEGMALGDELG